MIRRLDSSKIINMKGKSFRIYDTVRPSSSQLLRVYCLKKEEKKNSSLNFFFLLKISTSLISFICCYLDDTQNSFVIFDNAIESEMRMFQQMKFR